MPGHVTRPVAGAGHLPPLQPDVDPHLGLQVWTSPSGRGRLAFTDVPGYRVAAGDPRGPNGESCGMLAEFEEECSLREKKALYFGLPDETVRSLQAAGKRGVLHVGDAPVFHLERWSNSGSFPEPIRAQARRAARHGVSVRLLAAPPRDRTALQGCLDAWLRAKSLPPLGFATSPFLLDPWPQGGILAAERDGKVCGFLVSSRSLFRDLLRVDALIRAPDAPNGCAELLAASAFRAAWARGWDRATLGLAPLSRRAMPGFESPRAFHWLFSGVRRTGFPGYSFAGLEAFKAKFHPDAWRPLYCVSQGGRFSPADFTALLRAFAGGSLRRYAARALWWKAGRRGLSP